MTTFDAAIVGGGIIGGSIALELARHKLRVVLLDRQQPGHEASWAAAGMLSPSPDSPEALPLFPFARASLELYPEFVAAIEDASGLSARYRCDGTLEIFPEPAGEKERDQMVALHRRLGLATEAISLDRARRMEPALGPAARAAAWLPYEATVEPRALTEAVLKAAMWEGVSIRAGVEVTAIAREGRRATGVLAGQEKIVAGHVVVAAGCYSGRIDGLAPYAPTRPVRGQMVALQPRTDSLHAVLRSSRGYLVPRTGGHVIAGSTLENAGFEKFVTPSGLLQILSAAVELAPSLAHAEVVETWAGLRPDTPDHLPILGRTDVDGLLLATGHYRNGILLAPATAKAIRECVIDGRTSLPVEAFSPLRFAEAQREASV
jgi:glycine oxidase